jgi:3-hydroxymyristoyl/3-hydroxydecanoyl-(acyl carrier protein) dehydratase
VTERVYQPGHPATLGHFPGNPIVPGALLLSATLEAIEAGLNAKIAPFKIRMAKFRRPARPGDRIVIRYSRAPGSESSGEDIRFTCTIGESPVFIGQISCRALPKAE